MPDKEMYAGDQGKRKPCPALARFLARSKKGKKNKPPCGHNPCGKGY